MFRTELNFFKTDFDHAGLTPKPVAKSFTLASQKLQSAAMEVSSMDDLHLIRVLI